MLLVLHVEGGFTSVSGVVELVLQLCDGSLDQILTSEPGLDFFLSFSVQCCEQVSVLGLQLITFFGLDEEFLGQLIDSCVEIVLDFGLVEQIRSVFLLKAFVLESQSEDLIMEFKSGFDV